MNVRSAVGAAAIALAIWANAAAARDPVVFVPGIGGSVLTDSSNKMYYGGVKQTLDRFSALQLPIDYSKNKLRASEIVMTVQMLRGSSAKQYELLVDRLAAAGFRTGTDLFLFPYDWRRSSFDNAALLAAFVEKSGLKGRNITLMGHSMGGLVSLIYIHQYDRGQNVRTYITMGTPFKGAIKSARALAEGFMAFGVENYYIVPAGNESLVYKVFSSFDSVFEMLPTYADCCFAPTPDAMRQLPVDVANRALWNPVDMMQADFWATADNYLKEKMRGARRERLPQIAERVKTLKRLAAAPLPAGVRHIAVVSEAHDTLHTGYFMARGVGKPLWGVMSKSGDGTVPIESATGGPPAAMVIKSSKEHQFIFDDDAAWTQVRAVIQ